MVKWDMTGHWVLQHDRYTVTLDLEQDRHGQVDGHATYTWPGSDTVVFVEEALVPVPLESFGGEDRSESISGRVTDVSFTLDIDWGGASAGGHVGRYEAGIDGQGIIRGARTRDLGATSRRTTPFSAQPSRLRRRSEPPSLLDSEAVLGPPPVMTAETPIDPFPPPPVDLTVERDTDVFDQPDGAGTTIGMLTAGTVVTMVERGDNLWCRVEGDAVPPPGWVFGRDLRA